MKIRAIDSFYHRFLGHVQNGEVREVADSVGKNLCSGGLAMEILEKEPETATLETPEKATRKKPVRRTKK